MKTDFNKLIPDEILLFSILDINELGLIKSDMLRKLIYKQAIEVVKIGNKNFISRDAIIDFLERNVIPAELN